jgi:hypothetical protein
VLGAPGFKLLLRYMFTVPFDVMGHHQPPFIGILSISTVEGIQQGSVIFLVDSLSDFPRMNSGKVSSGSVWPLAV